MYDQLSVLALWMCELVRAACGLCASSVRKLCGLCAEGQCLLSSMTEPGLVGQLHDLLFVMALALDARGVLERKSVC